MFRTIKLATALIVLAALSGCSTLGAIVETTAQIAIGAAELIIDDEMGSTQYAPTRYYGEPSSTDPITSH